MVLVLFLCDVFYLITRLSWNFEVLFTRLLGTEISLNALYYFYKRSRTLVINCAGTKNASSLAYLLF